MSDEDVAIVQGGLKESFSIRRHLIQFPLIITANRITLRYTRSYGDPQLVLVVMFQSRELNLRELMFR